MKIVLDISPLAYGTGVSMYCRELVKALAKIDSTNEYILFAGGFRNLDFFKQWFNDQQFPSNFQLKTAVLPSRIQLHVWNNFRLLPIETFVGKVDVYHSLDWSLAPSKAKTIVTVHDLFFVKHPELQQHPYKSLLEKRLHTARQLQLPVIAVSETTKQDLIELINYSQHLITVIYEALPEIDFFSSNASTFSDLQQKYGISSPYFIATATQEPRKNLPRLIEAFGFLSDSKVSLVIVGKAGWGRDLPKPNDRVIFTGYLPDAELQVLRQHALALVYPSLYEGFGLPILEGFAAGVPVVTSNNSSMQEIAGDTAILINPYEIASITDGLQRVLQLSDNDRDELVSKGKKRLSQFSWERAAQQTLQLYQR